ncbi:hypothetical protein [Paraburkholderia sp. DGU8]|jgi:hypothetical protein|uniref:hypothetical protein n=1 Tax=Paraburkholderia sp. DGU8 TaxID=3161997 RepID=UPI00346625E3
MMQIGKATRKTASITHPVTIVTSQFKGLVSELNEGKQQSSIARNYSNFLQRANRLTPGKSWNRSRSGESPPANDAQTFADRYGRHV